jgi:sec-independent protein translocase protein TatA
VGLENPLHIAILLVVLLLLFGAKRLPELGRGLGSGIRSFKEGISGRDAPADAEPIPAESAAEQPRAALPAAPVAADPAPASPDAAETPVAHTA